MKAVIILSLFLLTSAAFGELTKEDLRTIIKEEVAASEKRMKEYIDLKIDAVNARIDALDQKVDVLDESLNARIDVTNTRIDVTNTRIDYVDEDFDPFLVTVIVLVVSTLLLPIVIALVYSKLM